MSRQTRDSVITAFISKYPGLELCLSMRVVFQCRVIFVSLCLCYCSGKVDCVGGG